MSKNKPRGIVYSTDPDFEYTCENEETAGTLQAGKQLLRVSLDKHQRAGKQVTLVKDFVGSEDDLEALGKTLKVKCGVGGSAKDGVIVIQGDRRRQIEAILTGMGYRVKVV